MGVGFSSDGYVDMKTGLRRLGESTLPEVISVKEISKICGLDESTVTRFLRRHGVPVTGTMSVRGRPALYRTENVLDAVSRSPGMGNRLRGEERKAAIAAAKSKRDNAE